MFSQFSVRRPYTVFVGVCLLVVLGIVSFTGMSTDLLPNLELPYIVVMTTYPGASPEQVETVVTRPLEAALGTAGGLKNIQSVSRENSSMIILEFVQTTNMDSAMIELSNTVDMLSSRLDNTISKPILMRINPEMMPIMVATVDMDGKEIEELSEFVNEIVLPRFERIDGVASVTASGLLQKQLRVELNTEKIAALNRQVLAELNRKLDDTRDQLLSAQTQLQKALSQLQNESGIQKDQLADASARLDSTIAQLNALLSEETILTTRKAALEQEKAMLSQLADQYPELVQMYPLIELLFPDGIAAVPPEQYDEAMEQLAPYLPEELQGLTQQEMAQLQEAAGGAITRLAAIDTELQSVTVQLLTIQAMKPQLEAGLAEATAAYREIEAGKITFAIEITKAEMQLINGRAELEKGLSELESARDEALSQADLKGIITAEMVSGILMAQNFTMPAGYIEEGESGHLVKVVGRYDSEDAIRSTLLFSMDGVGDIRLSDVADVFPADNANEIYAKVNGNDGVVVTFQKQSTASTAGVTGLIHEQIDQISTEQPGLNITPLMDQGEYINMSIDSILQNLLFGGVLAILVLIFFLKDILPTLIIAISIPVSLLFAVTLMYFSGVTLNIMSLSGLALGVGMLVDNSIVVIENIYRMRHDGVPVYRAAVQGAQQVTGAIFASTLTTVCVFLPIVFTQGISRQLFSDMGLTIGFSLMASLVVALTVVPTMASTVLKNSREKQIPWFDRLVSRYEAWLAYLLDRKSLVMSLVVVLLALSIYGVTVMGTGFIPEIDSPQMSATLTAPEGISSEDLYALSDDIIQRIMSIEAVESVGATDGSSGAFAGRPLAGAIRSGEISFFILLKDQRDLTNRDVEKLILEKTADIDADFAVSASGMDVSALGGNGVEIIVKGRDLDVLAATTNEVAEILRGTEGIGVVLTGYEDASVETRIHIDKDAAMKEGLTVAQIYQQLAKALSRESEATQLTTPAEEFPVMVVAASNGTITRENIQNFILTSETREGEKKEIPLKDVAVISEAVSPLAIRRENQARHDTIQAAIAEGYNIGLVSRVLEEKLAAYTPPEGVLIELAGENETINAAMRDLMLMILLAVVFIYLIMVAQFQSLLSPFIILFTLPLAFTGGLLLLWVSGLTLSVVAVLGFLVLAGVVVNNGIVFVDYVNQLRLSGFSKRDALLQTGRVRIRPIMMTALTTILAMSTIALGWGAGAEMMQPLAVVAIGGLTYATVLTLVVVPAMYDFLHRGELKSIDVDEE